MKPRNERAAMEWRQELTKKVHILEEMLAATKKQLNAISEAKINSEMCMKCGHTWTPRTPDPKMCPGCKSIYWRDVNQVQGECECAKCGYTWLPRKNQEPIMCPKCKTKYWKEEKNVQKTPRPSRA
jgi:predicted Zn-ribbon and HTH transcriptional regulator